MRNMRGAFGALLLAGAAYAWRNRDRLSQQLSAFRGPGQPDAADARRPAALPDYSESEVRDFDRTNEGRANERQFGGTKL